MRILHISSAKDFGGGERHFRDLTRGLIGRGHEVFAALRPTNTWERHLDFLPKERVLHTSIRNSFGILSSKRIAGFVRDNNIQIIHAHVARDYIPASVACLLANSAKFILTRHVLFGLKPFNKFALKNLSKAIAVSSGVEAELKRVFPAEKVAVIPHGIDMTVPAAGDRARLREEFRLFHQIPLDALVVGILGELIELKGQREFILAANEIVKQFPDARFVVVGVDHSIDQRFRRDLKRLAKTLDMDERFLWLDWLDDTEPFYCALDLFVSASHTESFGLAILEAMATGTPVIATETAGATELLCDRELLVPINDPVRLASAVVAMLSDGPRRESVGNKLATRAAENYSSERMIDATESLYREVLART